MSDEATPGSDAVGYGNPPKHSQWKKGQSGNPRGRKKGSRGLKTDLHAELESKMTIRINGQQVTATTQQLMIKTLCARAASGDVKAIGMLTGLVMQVFGPEDRGTGPARLSPADEALLDQLIKERGAGMPDTADEASEGGDDGD